jgi:L-ascorbate metabolism protein UlaG (beta-lactamase superfamily)
MPAGLVINFGGQTIYHLGDTALFSDLKLVAHRGDPIDVALMCIGGHYTMDRSTR